VLASLVPRRETDSRASQTKRPESGRSANFRLARPSSGGAGTVDATVLIEPGDPRTAFEIRNDRDARPVSPLIYGLNTMEEFDATVLATGFVRTASRSSR
jgi:hypothetical protein